jgi:hypothetical protein
VSGVCCLLSAVCCLLSPTLYVYRMTTKIWLHWSPDTRTLCDTL